MTAADEKTTERWRRKLAQRDRRIAGLERELAAARTALALQAMKLGRLPIDVERAVQRALCNVRMIPVLGLSSSDRIVEVRAEKTIPSQDTQAEQGGK